jgi:hypothetical protein
MGCTEQGVTTVPEIKRQALELLGRLRLGQDYQTQDNVAMQKSYDEVYASMREMGLATWTSTGDVPDELTPPIVALTAWNRIDVYGVSDSRYKRIAIRAGEATRTIRLFVTPEYESLEEPTDY